MEQEFSEFKESDISLKHMSWCLRATCSLAPPFLLNYTTQSPWWLHKLLLPNCSPCLGPCKWQPPWLPFASALVTDWYQYLGCPPYMRMAPLYKRAGSPSPWLTFWLNMISVTSRSKTRNLILDTHQTVGSLDTHSLIPYFANDLQPSTRLPAVAGDQT